MKNLASKGRKREQDTLTDIMEILLYSGWEANYPRKLTKKHAIVEKVWEEGLTQSM